MSDTVPEPAADEGLADPTPESAVVAATVTSLERLGGLEVAEHPAVFERIHADLGAVLNASADA